MGTGVNHTLKIKSKKTVVVCLLKGSMKLQQHLYWFLEIKFVRKFKSYIHQYIRSNKFNDY